MTKHSISRVLQISSPHYNHDNWAQQQSTLQEGLGKKRIPLAISCVKSCVTTSSYQEARCQLGTSCQELYCLLSACDGSDLVILEQVTHSAIPHRAHNKKQGSKFFYSPRMPRKMNHEGQSQPCRDAWTSLLDSVIHLVLCQQDCRFSCTGGIKKLTLVWAKLWFLLNTSSVLAFLCSIVQRPVSSYSKFRKMQVTNTCFHHTDEWSLWWGSKPPNHTHCSWLCFSYPCLYQPIPLW